MNHTWKLSNYLFRWNMWKKGLMVWLGSLGLGLILMLLQAFPKPAGINDSKHFPKAFLPYEAVVDGSIAPVVFLCGWLLLLILIVKQANDFFHHSKGIYSILTLPMKRTQIYIAFWLSAVSMMMLYFLSWLLMMVVLYAPIMSHYTAVAAKEVFYVSPELTVQGLDASRTNGLFLAFRRSIFLSAWFPTSAWQMGVFLCGMFLILSSVLYCGLHCGGKLRVLVPIFGCYWGLRVLLGAQFYQNDVDIIFLGGIALDLGIAILASILIVIQSLRSMKNSIEV